MTTNGISTCFLASIKGKPRDSSHQCREERLKESRRGSHPELIIRKREKPGISVYSTNEALDGAGRFGWADRGDRTGIGSCCHICVTSVRLEIEALVLIWNIISIIFCCPKSEAAVQVVGRFLAKV